MKVPFLKPGSQRRRPVAVATFLVVQTLAAVFFVGDALGELLSDADGTHSSFEMLVAVALITGMIFGGMELRRTLERMRTQEAALAVASGALADVIRAQFANWGLTGAEQDVAFLGLKGLDVAEIAEIRGSAQGTVRAQLTKVYAKAGVSNRAQFAALFVEDLLGASLVEPVAKAG
ncbi:MAG: LuxR family transcriptional regulator [Rhodobacterales bacterium 32-66-7]|nr:MAG: LuxR family transcriptional regulator [Rhodobacterales bacterium 12-65-15]OYX26679.1 MAG: LuxR family transcriptional regulator [Rhodobacterales bacterium 32-66-7]OZA03940.1 MAG: LuxR family transcriptional regulator [Rhodobacterales bacterium 17-64-5]